MLRNVVQITDILSSTRRAQQAASKNINGIQSVTTNLRVLALNALMEASRAGEVGRGFGVVAQEVKRISGEVEQFAKSLAQDLGGEISLLDDLTRRMAEEANTRRLIDLALNAIELIDRNLYERTCDVRWWATDAAVVSAAAKPERDALAYASKRLGVILKAYTVYLDIWLCDTNGRVLANGRPDKFRVAGSSVAGHSWFQKAAALPDGDAYAVDNVGSEALLGGAHVATYAASIRADGEANGRPLGVLAVHFDWQPQAQTIVNGVRLSDTERTRSRVLLVEEDGRIIASSDGRGLLTDRLPINLAGRDSGYEINANGQLAAFHRTPGYETYRGLGWYGVILQNPE